MFAGRLLKDLIALTCSRAVAAPGALSRLEQVLGELGLASDIDDLSECSSAQCDSDPNGGSQTTEQKGDDNDSLQTIEQKGDGNDSLQTIEQKGDDGSSYPGVMELSRIVDALFDLAPALDERIDQILEREKILEMRSHLPVDLRAIVVTVASKYPQAPDGFVLVVARRILWNRNRLQKKLTEGVREKPVAAYPEVWRPSVPTLFSDAPSPGSIDQNPMLWTPVHPYEIPTGRDPGPRSQQTMQTSIRPVLRPFVPRVDASMIASSSASSVYSDSKNAQLVQMPGRGSDGRIKCEICQQRLSIADDQSWK